ncbi:hypothetical protein BGX30_006937, partial [Mortierella sp. GBA39]
MAEDLTLFCLIDEQSTSKAFSVEISPKKTVDGLKKFIRNEKPNELRDVDPDRLTLWLVFIPDDNQNSAITLDALDDKTQLNNPRTLLSTLFPESPDDNTYIIVQRPPQ